MIILKNNLNILELSSSSVKLLSCPRYYTKEFNKFSYKSIKTLTSLGLSGGKMNLGYFEEEVMPKITEITRNIDNIICIATAWAREASNISKIQDLIPFKINVLSEEEEASFTLNGYINTAKRDLSKYNYIISIDPGSKSTDIKMLGGDYVSIDKNNLDLGYNRLKLKFGDLKYKDKVLIAITGERISELTGKINKQERHDQELDIDKLNWHPGLQSIFNIIGRNHTLVSNCASLSYGIFYSYIKNNNKFNFT